MGSPFHDGELAVQAHAGVRDAAEALSGVVRPALSAQAAVFVAGQRLALVGTADAAGRLWASALTGDPGVIRALDPQTLEIGAAPAAGDPLAETLARGAEIEAGVLVIDLQTRKRLRVNGRAEPIAGGGLRLHAEQVYWNCPQYIHVRRPEPVAAEPPSAAPPRRASRLTSPQREWIARADTFFIATAHPSAGADVSHRGGEPGFVQLSGDEVLAFPDYSGNNLFNTFGNLEVNPAAGILFIDFARGATLQLTGRAQVLWEGTQRAVRFQVAEVIELEAGVRVHWR